MAIEMTMLSISRDLHTRIKKLAEKKGMSMRELIDSLITSAETK